MSRLLTTRTEYKISGYSLDKFNDIYFGYTDLPLKFPEKPILVEILRNSVDVEDIKQVVEVTTSTFNIVNLEDVTDINKYRIFKIINISKTLPIHHVIMAKTNNEKHHSTLNVLEKTRRSDNRREYVMMYLLAIKYNLKIYNDKDGVVEYYNKRWDEIINDFFSDIPEYRAKIMLQIEEMDNHIDFTNINVVAKNHSKFVICNKARKLFRRDFPDKNYKFQYNKWNPSDIWLIQNEDQINNINNFTNLSSLNNYLKESIKNNNGIIGISLKLGKKNLDDVTLDLVNFYPPLYYYTYEGYEMPKNEGSMTSYIIYRWNNSKYHKTGTKKIELRFPNTKVGNINAEIVGTCHMSGRIGSYYYSLFGDKFLKLRNIIKKSESKKELYHIIDNFNFKPHIKKLFISVLDNGIPMNYKQNARLQALLVINMVENYHKGADYAIDQMVNFGRGETDISAAHYRLK